MRLLIFAALATFVSRSNSDGLFGFDPLKGIGDAVKDAAAKVDRVVKNPKGAWDDFVNKTTAAQKETSDDIKKKVKEGLKDPVGAVKNIFQDTGKSVKSAVNNTTNSTKAVGRALNGGAENRTSAPNLLKDFGDKLEGAFKDPLGSLGNLAKGMGSGFDNVVNKTLGNVKNITDGIGKGLAKTPGLNDFVNKTFGNVQNITNEIGKGFSGPLGALRNLTKEVTSGIGDTLSKTIGTVKNITDGVENDLKDVITKQVGDLKSLTKDLRKTIESVLDDTKKQVDDLKKNLANNAGSTDPFDEALSKLDEAVEDDSVLETIGAAASAIFRAIVPVFSGKPAKQALDRLDEIGERASETLPWFLKLLMIGPMNSIKGPLKLISFIQSLSGRK